MKNENELEISSSEIEKLNEKFKKKLGKNLSKNLTNQK
jgi:hypothetical protein